MNQESSSPKPGNNVRLAWAVIITLIAGLIIGGAIGFGLCPTHQSTWACCGKDMSVTTCPAQKTSTNRKKSNGGSDRYNHYIINSQSCNSTTGGLSSDDATEIKREDAKDAIRNYGVWAAYVARQIEDANDTLPPNSVRLTSNWTVPLTELLSDLDGASYARAFLAIKNPGSSINNLPEVSLIFSKVKCDGTDNGADVTDTIYHNLVRPCPNMCPNEDFELYRAYKEGHDPVIDYIIETPNE